MSMKNGSRNIRSKLAEDDVLWIYENQNEYSQTELAKRFGVTQGAINHIITGRSWAWLTKHQR